MNATMDAPNVTPSIEAAARGDEQAVAAILAAHGALVFNTCLRVLGNREEAEDAAQATFILFLKKAKSLDPKTILPAWLHRTAELVSRSHLRSARRRSAHEKEAAMRQEPNAETESGWVKLRPELDAAIAQLPERYRNAIVLAYMEGRSTAEAGAILGVPQSTVTTWLDRGRQKLRELLARRGVELNAAVLVTLLSSKLAESTAPATLAAASIAAAKGLAAGTLEASLPLKVSQMLKGALKMMYWIKIKYACLVLAVCLLAGVATPLAIRAASEEKTEMPAPAPVVAPVAPVVTDAPIDPSKPLVIGEMAYTGGAFTADGKHFVFAAMPKPGTNASELKSIEIKTLKVESLGLVPLLQKPTGKQEEWFKWSMGVFAADDDLGVVYMGQFGPDVDLDAKHAIAWDPKKSEQRQMKRFPDLQAMQKERAAPPKDIKVAVKELDEAAGTKRKEYVPAGELEKLLGKKELSIELTGAARQVHPLDVTEIYKALYAKSVEMFPKNRMAMDNNGLLESDSVEALAHSGKWILIRCGIYVHYGIHGHGYGSLALINIDTAKTIAFPQITSYSASGMRVDPIQEAFIASPDGSAVAGMSQGQLMIYRLPAE
jgi:RNA polymerase sigma factor (sigma-70 family)